MSPIGEMAVCTHQSPETFQLVQTEPAGQLGRCESAEATFIASFSAINTTGGPVQKAPCKQYEGKPVMVAVGGIDLHSLDSQNPGRCVYSYRGEEQGWTSLSELHTYTHHHGVATIASKLYVCGGATYDPSNPNALGNATSEVHCLDTLTGTWKRLSPMQECRAYVGVAAHNGYLYAVGGEDAQRWKLDTIECYDPLMDSWCYVGSLPGGPRIGAACAIHKEQLYIIGGYNSENRSNPVMDEVLCFDLLKHTWVPKTPLMIPRCHASLVEVQGQLILVGGRTKLDGQQPPIISLAQVERYDDVNDAWDHVTDLKVPRHDAGCTAIGSVLYIVGGMKTPSPYCLQDMEVVDIETGCLLEPVTSLPYPATGLACTTISLQDPDTLPPYPTATSTSTT